MFDKGERPVWFEGTWNPTFLEQKGYIRANQVGQILRTMGQAFEERDLKQLIKEFDSDGNFKEPGRSVNQQVV